MFEYPVVYVDIETTGGSYLRSRILEIAMIRVERGIVTREFSTLLDPETPIPTDITRLTGIRMSDVRGKPVFADVADEIAQIMSDAVFIAHNVRFDYSFIRHEFARMGTRFSPKLLCTVRLSRALYAEQRGHSLAKLIERHNIPVEARHRALEDAKATLLFTQIALQEHGAERFADAVSRQLRTQSLPPHLDASQVSDIEDVAGVYIFRDEAGMPLYIGKSITLKKRVMSHFQSTSPKELKISQQVHSIETIKTGSELGALILESRLIKELQPLHNRLLRRTSQYAMLVKTEQDGYATLAVCTGSLDGTSDLSAVYGIYRNRTLAKKKLDDVTRTFELCPKLMGLEKARRACFSYSLGRCRGACIGEESPDAYNARFETALEHSKVPMWEYESAVYVPVNEEGEGVVINNWIIQGFLDAQGEMIISDDEPSFDIDEFRIVYRFLRQHRSFVRPYAPTAE